MAGKAEAQNLSIRELIIEVTGRQLFAGSPATVAGQINNYVQAGASDGYILVPPSYGSCGTGPTAGTIT